MDAQQLWTECSEMLRTQVSEATWKTWFEAIRPVAVSNRTVVLAVPSALVRERLEGRYKSLLSDALAESVGGDVPLRFVLYQETQEGDETGAGDDETLSPVISIERIDTSVNGGGMRAPDPPTEHRPLGARPERRENEVLNPRYTFDAFVVGS